MTYFAMFTPEGDAAVAKIVETAKRKGDDSAAARAEHVGPVSAQFDKGDEFVQHDLGAEQSARHLRLVPGDAQQEHDRREYPAQHRLEGQPFDAHQLARA